MEKRLHEHIDKIVSTKKLSASEEKVLNYILNHLESSKNLSIRSIAIETYTSNSTIMRLSKKLGYSGYSEMLYDFKDKGKGKQAFVDAGLSEEYAQMAEAEMIHLQAILRDKNRRITIIANGFSEVVGEYMYKKLATIGYDCVYVAGGDCYSVFKPRIQRTDIIIAVSKSGETEGILYRVKEAKEHQVEVLAITGNEKSSLASLANINLLIMDQHQTDASNFYANPFFGYALLAFEKILGMIQEKENAN